MSREIIRLNGVNKAYSSKYALKGLNLEVPEGAVYGLLGQNGAGKSTCLRLIMGLLKADAGQVQVLGQQVGDLSSELRQQIGYCSESLRVIPWLTVAQALNYNQAFYRNWDTQYVAGWLDKLALDPKARVFSLSRGGLQKLGLIMAIGHRPRLLILDEPAGGLDPIARKIFLESMIELLHETGTTIVISSHQIQDMERICDTVGLLKQGRMQVEGELEQFKKRTRRLRILKCPQLPDLGQSVIYQLPGQQSSEWVIDNWNPEMEQHFRTQIPAEHLVIDSLSLEEIFVYYARQEVQV